MSKLLKRVSYIDPVMKSIKELGLELEVGELCVDREISDGRQEVEGLNKIIFSLTKDLQAEKAKALNLEKGFQDEKTKVFNLEKKLQDEHVKLSSLSKDLKSKEQKVANLKKRNSTNISKAKRALSTAALLIGLVYLLSSVQSIEFCCMLCVIFLISFVYCIYNVCTMHEEHDHHSHDLSVSRTDSVVLEEFKCIQQNQI